jgi:hypothetical protein
MEKGLLTVIGIAGLLAYLCRDKKTTQMSGVRRQRKELSDLITLKKLYSSFLNSDNDKTYVATLDECVAHQIGSNEKVNVRVDREGILHKKYADGRKTKLNIGKDNIIETGAGEFAIKERGFTMAKIIAPKCMITTRDYLGQKFAEEINNHTSEDIQILSSANRALEERHELFKKAQKNAKPEELNDDNWKPLNSLSGHDKELLEAIGARFRISIG